MAMFSAAALVVAVAHADATHTFAAPETAANVHSVSATGLGHVTLALAIVVIAILALAWLVRRLRGFNSDARSVIRVVAEVAIGPKERAVLLEIGTARLLVGVAPGCVNTLHLLANDVSSQAQGDSQSVSAAPGETLPLRPTFRELLMRSLGR